MSWPYLVLASLRAFIHRRQRVYTVNTVSFAYLNLLSWWFRSLRSVLEYSPFVSDECF